MTLLLLLRSFGVSVHPAYSNPRPFAWDEPGETPDELVARLEFTTVLCKSTGEPVDILDTLQNRQIVQQLNLPASYAITMRMDDANYPYALLEQQPRLKVYRVSTPAELAIDPLTVNQLVFYGSLPSEGIDEDSETGFATLTFQEPSWVLNQRYLPAAVTFTQIDQGAILWSIIATQNQRTNGDTFIRQGSTTTGIKRDRTYEAGKEVAGLIQEMTQVDNGCDVGLTPFDYWSLDGGRGMAKFNAYKQRGSAKPDALFIHGATLTEGTYGGVPANVMGMRRTRAQTITSATSVGSSDAQTYANATSGYGLLEAYETFSDISISQTLLDKSVGKVANGQNAPMVIEIKTPLDSAPQPFLDYNLGDTVYATERRGGMQFYSLPVRVHGIDVSISQEGKLTTKPTVATLPETIVSPILPTGGGGSGVPALPPVGGDERIGPPTTVIGTGAAVDIDPTVLYSGGSSYRLTIGSTSSSGKGIITGLTSGHRYTLTAWVRGPTATPSPAGTSFTITGDDDNSSNNASNIWSSTLATRETWRKMTVGFTAPKSTVAYTFTAVSGDAGSFVYSSGWDIE